MANIILREIGEADPAASAPSGVKRRATLEALEDYMSGRQNWNALTVVRHEGHVQRASESLLCLRVNELHGAKATLPLITAPSFVGLHKWLDGDPAQGWLSVFQRFEKKYGVVYREPDGSLVRIDSHMCRRLFVTSGLTAGATTLDVARWQGREHIGDLRSYDQRSMAEKVEAVQDAIRTGRLQGQIVQTYMRLAEDIREEWLDGQVQAMHVTPLGLCVHDFAATPCPKALNCLKNCKDYVHDPRDAGQRQVLVTLEHRTREVLVRMRPLVEAGAIASSWLEEQRETLQNVQQILAINPATTPDAIRPFAGGASRFEPVTTVN